ncbi:MAG: nucleotidyltransferase family protein [Xanthomonadales bacterium]|nr:nucleotidyltransferase family protein [Xanthomonadales bacterium]
MPTEIWALILAAGESRRLGSPKQQLQWQGRTLLQHAVQTARAVVGEHIMVVLGCQAERLSRDLDCDWTTNPKWQEGMGSSLALGASRLPEHAAVLILLCDQPRITVADLAELRDRFLSRPENPAVSVYQQTWGVPVLFPPTWRSRLLGLTGDRGARALLRDQENLTRVPMENAAFDVDTPADRQQLEQQ